MKAPDKINVREFPQGLSQMWHSVLATETSAIAQHEYIRKDALLEWAKDRLEFAKALDSQGQIIVCEELIDKLESM